MLLFALCMKVSLMNVLVQRLVCLLIYWILVLNCQIHLNYLSLLGQVTVETVVWSVCTVAFLIHPLDNSSHFTIIVTTLYLSYNYAHESEKLWRKLRARAEEHRKVSPETLIKAPPKKIIKSHNLGSQLTNTCCNSYLEHIEAHVTPLGCHNFGQHGVTPHLAEFVGVARVVADQTEHQMERLCLLLLARALLHHLVTNKWTRQW